MIKGAPAPSCQEEREGGREGEGGRGRERERGRGREREREREGEREREREREEGRGRYLGGEAVIEDALRFVHHQILLREVSPGGCECDLA